MLVFGDDAENLGFALLALAAIVERNIIVLAGVWLGSHMSPWREGTAIRDGRVGRPGGGWPPAGDQWAVSPVWGNGSPSPVWAGGSSFEDAA